MKKINYGVDAPVVIRNLLVIGVLLLLIAFFLPADLFPPISGIIASSTFLPGVCLVIAGLLMLLYARYGKFRQRDRILAQYSWKGDETVLDVGTGLGLLMIGAAKKLNTGKAYGIDIFNSYDLSGNTLEQLKTNIELEHVGANTVIQEQNIKHTDFQDAFFDVIVSNLCLHNIYEKEGRKEACREIGRLLKPGGKAIISDFKHTGGYAAWFKEMGMQVHKAGTYFLDTFPPLTIIVAEKN